MKGEGHISGGSQCSKIVTKKAEGELVHSIPKVAKLGFPNMGKKVWHTAFKYAREKVSVPKKQLLGTSGYVALWGELKGLQ